MPDIEATEKLSSARPRPIRSIVVAIVAGIAAAGLGYYAWTLRSQRADALAEVAESRNKTAACVGSLSGEGGTIATLSAERDVCQNTRQAAKEQHAETDKNQAKLEKSLEASREELEKLRKQRAEAEERLQAFRELTTKLKKMIDVGTINVVVRKGHLLVELPAAVLFAPASAELADAGKPALIEVGVILKKLPDRRFMIAGHTDNAEPAESGGFKNNWELSIARALTVTEFLIGVGMKSESLVAAGSGSHDPVADNKSEEGRAKNRRIEIILLPNLEDLPLGKQPPK